MGLKVIETSTNGGACCAKSNAAPSGAPRACCAAAGDVPAARSAEARSVGGTIAYLAAGLVAWTAAYLAVLPLSRFLAFRALGLSPGSHLGEAVAFFLYDTPKVLLLLTLIVLLVGIVRSFFTPERTRALLAGRRESVGNVLAALLGTVTPFCSCSAVPLFIGFVEVGIPLGVTLSFLVSAPMVNEVALILLFGLFGWKVAALYLATGLLVAIVSGFVLGRMRLERFVEPWVYESMNASATFERERLGFVGRVGKGMEAVRDIVGKVWPWVVLGIAVGAGIHGYVPEGFLASVMGRSAWWSVPLAVVIGVPMYSNAAGIIPVVQALLGKGAALGTVLAFMMSVIALSLPEMIILRKVLKPRLIATFVGVVAGGILLVGWLFNAVM
ncbi:MAG TPA: permease [Anaeromyxobacteraceae bacterium]|nr:permease [Anaeromyxobacteraceae bacterium]